MSEVTINVTGLQALSERLLSLGQNLPEMLMAANEEIVAETEVSLADLYPNLQSRFRVTVNDSPGGAASVRVVGSQAIVKWYEYGTGAHSIDAEYAQVLAFPGTHGYEGQYILTPHVNHPGAKAHNEKEVLMADMLRAGVTAWGTAIADIVTYL